jgi:hypothetical protein
MSSSKSCSCLLAGFFRWFAQGLAVEGEAVRGMDEAVEDSIGDCRIGAMVLHSVITLA